MTAARKGSNARRLAGVGAGVLLIALATGARGPGGGSAEAFVKPAVVPLHVSPIPESIADAAVEAVRPSVLSPGDQTLAVGPLDWSEIPPPALRAYQRAALIMEKSAPGCGLTWEVLAGIGRVESDHGRFGGATVNTDGTTTPQIFGVPLNGAGNIAAISDTENGTLDGDSTWDRAVGPMQFLPTTWDVVGVDADGDGIDNPHDFDDAALAAGVYLCAGDVDLTDRAQLEQALWRYNPSEKYVALVLSYIDAYRRGEPAPSTNVATPVTEVPTLDELPDAQPHPTNNATSNVPGSPTDPNSPNDGPGGQSNNNDGPGGQQTNDNDGPGGIGTPPDGPEPPPNNPPPDDDPPPPPPDDDPPPPDDDPPPPDPGPVTLTGTLESSGAGWLVGGKQVDFGSAEFTDQWAAFDYDVDETREKLIDELNGLVGTTVTVEGEQTGTIVVVSSINGDPYGPGDAPPEPTPTEPSATEPSPSEPSATEPAPTEPSPTN